MPDSIPNQQWIELLSRLGELNAQNMMILDALGRADTSRLAMHNEVRRISEQVALLEQIVQRHAPIIERLNNDHQQGQGQRMLWNVLGRIAYPLTALAGGILGFIMNRWVPH